MYLVEEAKLDQTVKLKEIENDCFDFARGMSSRNDTESSAYDQALCHYGQ